LVGIQTKMTTVPKTQYDNMVKQRAFAWHKYYEETEDGHHIAFAQIENYKHMAEDATVPTHIKTMIDTMGKELHKKWDCPVCADFIPDGELLITNCGHFFCKDCLKGWKDKCKAEGKDRWACPHCNRQHKFNGE